MDRRLPQQRSRSYRGGFVGRKPIAAAPSSDLLSAGNGQLRRRLNDSKIASDSSSGSSSPLEEFTCDSRRSSSRKPCGRPIKTLIHEEMSREKESRRSSPSVIARLMGLDALPPSRVLDKQQKDSRSCMRKTTHAEDVSQRMSYREQEFKDVFEIRDSMKAEKHKTQPLCKGIPSSKRDETDVEFIKQKFMEAKRLSTDETLQNSKEFNDALEVLDSNKDLFLKVLQEPLFTKHPHDRKCFATSPHESQITILKSSKGKKHEIAESICNSEGKAKSCHSLHKDVISSYRKPKNGLVNYSLKEHSDSLSHKLLKSWTMGKTKRSYHPTQIVVLRTSVEKHQNMARNVSATKSHDNYQPSFQRHRNHHQSRVQELNAGRERQKLYDNVEAMGHKTKSSREIAREITKQMKQSVSGYDNMPISGFDKYIMDESLCAMSSRCSSNKFEAYRWTPNDYMNARFSPSSSCSTESSMNIEAKKRLFERWRMTQRYQEARLLDRGSSTLGEMLALSDRDASRETLMSQKGSDDKLPRGLLGTGCHPPGISSRDGWKEGSSKFLSRSSTLSPSAPGNGILKSSCRQQVGVSDGCYMLEDVLNLGADDFLLRNSNQRGSSSCRTLKPRSYKSRFLNSGGEENNIPVREIHVNKEELSKETNSIKNSEIEPTLSGLSASTSSGFGNQVKDSSIESMNAEVPFITNEGHVQHGAQDGEFSEDVYTDKVLEETSTDHPQVDSPRKQCDGTDPGSHKSLEEADQPSPVSVLELPYEEKSSPECFERVGADLKELRMQLQLLRLETSGTDSEAPVLSEDDTGDCSSPAQIAEMLQAFRNEDDRDFSYLLDILVYSGVHEIKLEDGFSQACYSSECPVDPYVFGRLEKKYGALGEWSRSQRKLFFEHTSSILAEILAPFMDVHPWVKLNKRNTCIWDHERLCEEVWQMVVRQRKELGGGNPEATILDPRWFVLGDDVNTIGREIEEMVQDDLLDDLVSDFVLALSGNCPLI